MVRGVVRGVAYLPRFTDGRRRVGAPDEDAFTFAATALERASRRESSVGRPPTLRAIGVHDPPGLAALEAILGAPARRSPSEGGDGSVAAAVREASEGTGPGWIVAVASDGDGRGGSALAPPGEGAAALLIDDRAGAIPLAPSLNEDDERRHGALAALFAFVRAHPDPNVWEGDWGADPANGAASHPASGRATSPEFTVSQGAFVPAPRYEESRPSRWRFVADRCAACGVRTFPSRARCRGCGATEGLRPEPLPLDGARVVASTWIGQGGQPTEFDRQVETSGSYGVVLAEIAPDVRVTLTVADARPEDVRVGSTVDTVLRRLYPIEGSWRYGRKAVPPRRLPGGHPSRSGTA